MIKILGLLALATSLWGCKTVESVSISQIPTASQRENKVRASANSPIIFLIPFGSSYIDEARASLLDKCERDEIEGLMSKFETTNYFLGLFVVQRVELEGYCIRRSKRG